MNLPKKIFGKDFETNFEVEDSKSLQFRWIASGKYKGKKAFAKLIFKKDDTAQAHDLMDKKRYIEWAWKTLENSIKAHELFEDLDPGNKIFKVPRRH